MRYNIHIFPGSSMVEQEAVNFEVTGSSPVRGAKSELKAANAVFFCTHSSEDPRHLGKS